MKKFAQIVVLAVVTAFMACGDLNEQPSDEKYINVEVTSKSLESTKGNFKLVVESNTEWSITTSAEWLTILGSTEHVGTCEVAFSYGENTSTKSRNAKVEIEPMVAGEASPYTILVSQKAASNTGGGNTGGGNTGGNDDNTGGSTGDDNTGGNDDNTGDNGGGGLVGNSGAKYTGWAELPAENKSNSDYYYAYHMRSDYGSQRNFSVCYSASMGCPVWVAAPIHKCYCGSGRSENYAPDPVIPASVQKNADVAGDTNKGNWMNRGHMLASNMRNITAATNKQVFYYSNIAPQDGNYFNTGGGWWNNLEDIEKGDFMCADTLYTVNGCHWTNNNETMGGRIVPTHFYKVFLRTKKGSSGKSVFECSTSELQCVAFYAAHSVGKVNPSRSHMISVAELERITGHTFFPNVPNAPKDTFSASDWGM